MAEKTFHSLTLPGQDTARVPLTAVEFNTSTAYKVKDYCTYQGKLYRCTVAHAAGAWNASHFVETDMDAELDRKLDIPPSQASAPANPRVGDLWIDNDENSPIYNVDVAPTLGSTNAVQSGGTKTALNAIDSRKVEHGCITGDFSASVDYRVGDLVFYATTANGITTRTLYRCTTDHDTAAWNPAHFTATTLEVELQRVRDNEADTDMIGDLFGSKTKYAVGNYCIYNDNLYRCKQTVDNTGVATPAFDPDDWQQVALANEVSDLNRQISLCEDGVFEIGDAIVPSMGTTGYKIAVTGSAADSDKRTEAFAISDKPIYIKTQDGYQYRSDISASTMISTSMGAFEGWVYPRGGANYVAISFDKTATIYGAFESEYAVDVLDEKIDTINEMFELAGNSLQAFDKDSCVLANDIYLNISDQLISFSGCLIITSEINAHVNDIVTYKCFKDSIYSSSIFMSILPFVSDVLPNVGATVLQSERTTINAPLMRGFMKLNTDAKYFNLMIRFDTTAHRDAYKADVVDNLVVKIGSQNQDYPQRYTPYVFDVSESAKQTYWSGKRIWWCGTSIPAGKDQAIGSESTGLSYPEYIGELLNATVFNEALGSSMCRANVRTGNYVNALSHNIIYSLTQTTEEKQYLINNWSTIKTVLYDPDTYASLSDVASDVLGASFEARLTPYLNGTKPMPDLFVIDHGHNDWKPYYTMPDGTTPDTDLLPTPGKITANILAEDTYMTANNNAKLVSFFGEVNKIPSSQLDGFITSVNRNCFIGAVNFLCTYILSKNPRARIVFIGNLDNWQKPQVQTAQETLSKEWEFPLVKMWEYSGFSWHYIPNTYNLWNPSGTTDLTMKQIYCKDSVHPHSDTEGITIPMYANTIANALKNIV